MGKINPKCTILLSPNWVVFNPGFSRVCSLFIIVLREIKADGRKMHSILLSYFTKKQRFFFY